MHIEPKDAPVVVAAPQPRRKVLPRGMKEKEMRTARPSAKKRKARAKAEVRAARREAEAARIAEEEDAMNG